MEKRIKFLLLLVILFVVIQHFIFLQKDKFPPIHDEFRSFISNEYLDNLKNSSLAFLKISLMEVIPPLYNLLSLPFYILFGRNIDVLGAVNIFWLVLLIISIYLLGKKLLGPNYGLIAVIILLGFPAVIGYSRICYYPIALTATVTLSYYYLINSDSFKNKNAGYCWGLVYIIGLLIHPYFLIYTFPGLIFSFLYIRDKKQILNFLKVPLLILLFSGSWYFSVLLYPSSRINLLNFVKPTFLSSSILDKIKGYILPSHILYFQIVNYYWIFVLSFFYLIIKIRELGFIYIWIFFSFFLILFHPTQIPTPRFLLPILPSMAILITYFISQLSKKIKLKFLIIMLFILSFSSYVKLKYMKNPDLDMYFYVGKIFPNLIGEEKIIGFISDNLSDPNPFITQAVIYESIKSIKRGYKNIFWNLWNIIEGEINYSKFISQSDFILYVEANFLSDFPRYRKEQLIKLQKEFEKRRIYST